VSDGTSKVSRDLAPEREHEADHPVGRNRAPGKVWLDPPSFPQAAGVALRDSQLRHNLARATTTIRAKRNGVVGELPDWEELRLAGAALKDEVLNNLDRYLLQVEERVTAAGGQVHWARDAEEANRIVVDLVKATGVDEVVKVKSMATMEIELNEALAEAGVAALETDLAELIVQLGDDRPSHILVPAIHKNRSEIRELFLRTVPNAPADLTDEPRELAAVARAHLRRKFLSAKVAISGANFIVADTGTLVVVESEGNGRMCLTLPETLISVVGIEKVVPTWQDLEVFLQLLPRSSTGERMNPYTSTWTGVTPGDGPQTFHLVLLDNGRTSVLADAVGRQALRCIRCSACLNVCPVYERTGGHAYGSVYPGPIGAILNPLLHGTASERDRSLPYASTLCGRCFEVCPVRIDIPEVLVHLRGTVVDDKREARVPSPEMAAMKAAAFTFSGPRRLAAAERLGALAGRVLGRDGKISWLPRPMNAWTQVRDAPAPPAESFRAWWRRTQTNRETNRETNHEDGRS
jgi:L-lactate dehydrogenase complex protein LldF